MYFTQRKVPVGEFYPAVVLGEDVFQSGLGLLAERALKIGELDDGDRGLRISFDTGWVVGDVKAGRPQQNRDLGLGAQGVGVLFSGLLNLGALRKLFNLRL